MRLTLESSEGGISRVRCEGAIDGNVTANARANPLEEVMGMGCYGSRVLLNLEQATSIDSRGVAWLVRCHRDFTGAGGKLVLHSIPPAVDHVLRIMNMQLFLNLVEGEKEALNLVSDRN